MEGDKDTRVADTGTGLLRYLWLSEDVVQSLVFPLKLKLTRDVNQFRLGKHQ